MTSLTIWRLFVIECTKIDSLKSISVVSLNDALSKSIKMFLLKFRKKLIAKIY